MSHTRTNRLGHQYGIFLVVEEDGRLWRIRCTNCGYEQLVSAEKCGMLSRRNHKRCGRCPYEEPVAAPPTQAELKPDPLKGVLIPGYGFFPFLTGPMGRG